jgi:hypothetical protein
VNLLFKHPRAESAQQSTLTLEKIKFYKNVFLSLNKTKKLRLRLGTKNPLCSFYGKLFFTVKREKADLCELKVAKHNRKEEVGRKHIKMNKRKKRRNSNSA